MVAFFTDLFIIGIILILFSIIMVMFDRKRDLVEKSEIISIKNELQELLEDSNEMVDELNRFSDYIITKVDEKCCEYMNLIKSVPDSKVASARSAEIKDSPAAVVDLPFNIPIVTEGSDIDIKNEEILFSEDVKPLGTVTESRNNDISHRHGEVIKLFEAGMSDSEIAKALNMGKGEVQLIVGLNLHKIKV